MSSTQKTTEQDSIPGHVAIIMDGNGRWAQKRGLPRIAGHRRGVENVREIINACTSKNIDYLTLFAFSSENWRRPEREVTLLLDLFLNALEKEIRKLHKNNIKFRVIGEIEPFGKKIVERIKGAEELTQNNSQLTVTVAANYGGRWDIAQACAVVARKVKSGEIDPDSIGPETLEPYLSMYEIPEPDLFIRSGGEQRISNFLLWQIAYSELYFTETLWPEFGRTEFDSALESYSQRQRRFGLTGEQTEAVKHA
ncbi:MAG: polyprenyl diphosphate synthase [Gammaproteobacteria bacterium]|nr:MAG: polyprenyl diphosphate synthase [Gammaproteobacteria bacterium]